MVKREAASLLVDLSFWQMACESKKPRGNAQHLKALKNHFKEDGSRKQIPYRKFPNICGKILSEGIFAFYKHKFGGEESEKALLVIDMQNVCVGKNHATYFKFDNEILIQTVNEVIDANERQIFDTK